MDRGQRGLANFPVDLKEQEAALFKAAEKKPIVKPPALEDKPPEPTKAELSISGNHTECDDSSIYAEEYVCKEKQQELQ